MCFGRAVLNSPSDPLQTQRCTLGWRTCSSSRRSAPLLRAAVPWSRWTSCCPRPPLCAALLNLVRAAPPMLTTCRLYEGYMGVHILAICESIYWLYGSPYTGYTGVHILVICESIYWLYAGLHITGLQVRMLTHNQGCGIRHLCHYNALRN